jgi:glutamate-ammonia-ligase adenylyltransferase
VGERFAAIREDGPAPAARCRRNCAARSWKCAEDARRPPQPSGLFDLKHDRGGLVDVEFAVQYLVLSQAADHPEMTANIGNIALLKCCADLGLLQADTAHAAADAYRELRRMQHQAKLQGDEAARIDADLVPGHGEAVKRLWQEVFAS